MSVTQATSEEHSAEDLRTEFDEEFEADEFQADNISTFGGSTCCGSAYC